MILTPEQLAKWRWGAEYLAAMSPDPSTKVGCVITKAGKIYGKGFNHFPKGTPEKFWENRTEKYRHVVHAEVWALLAAGKTAKGSIMMCSHHPCRECALLIVAAGVATLICPSMPWRDDVAVIKSVEEAREILKRGEVELVLD